MTSFFLATATLLAVHPFWPWPTAVATAMWFGAIGHKYRHAGAIWGLAGLAVGLVISELSCGLGNAVAVPYAQNVINRYQADAFAVSVVVIAFVGCVLVLLANRRSLVRRSEFVTT